MIFHDIYGISKNIPNLPVDISESCISTINIACRVNSWHMSMATSIRNDDNTVDGLELSYFQTNQNNKNWWLLYNLVGIQVQPIIDVGLFEWPSELHGNCWPWPKSVWFGMTFWTHISRQSHPRSGHLPGSPADLFPIQTILVWRWWPHPSDGQLSTGCDGTPHLRLTADGWVSRWKGTAMCPPQTTAM